MQLNVDRAGLQPGARVEIEGRPALVATTFADAAEGQLILYENSSGYLTVAVSGGSAANELGLRAGGEVEIRT